MTVGRYTLLREIARGGMAELWLAQQPGPQGFSREVAVKRILFSDDQPSDFERMFFDEAKLVSQLSHPNIVQVFEFAEHESTPYIVMEYLAGESLSKIAREVAERGTPMPIPMAVAIVERCAAALGYAHRKRGGTGEPLNVVHRDVSPQNVFITYEGVVKVLDFGIARALGRATKTETGLVKGKAAYMPPEQASGKSVDATADVFALGVMLFELLSGKRMHADADPIAIFTRLVTSTTPFAGPASLRAEVPAKLDAIVQRALSLAPRDRFSDGLEMAEALAEWQRSTASGTNERELYDFMHVHFTERIAALQQFLYSARSGVIPEVPTPSKTQTMPGHTPGPTVAAKRRPAKPLRVFALSASLSVLAAIAAFYAVTHTTAEGPPPPEPIRRPPPKPPVVAAPAPPEPKKVEPPPIAVEPAPVKEPTKPVRLAKVKLNLDTSPWTRVFLGRTKLGDTPLIDAQIPPGPQTLRLVNESAGIDTTIEIEGRPGERLVKNLSL